MPEVEPIKRGRGRPPGAKNKPKPGKRLITENKVIEDIGINSLHPAPKIAKELRRLAESTGFTLKRIFDDMCENGIIEIQTMYLEVITARRDIQKALDLLDGKITAKRSVGAIQHPPETIRNGEPHRGVGGDLQQRPVSGPEDYIKIEHQPDYADVIRGLQTPPRAHPESVDTDMVDPSFATNFEDPLNEPEEPEDEVEETLE